MLDLTLDRIWQLQDVVLERREEERERDLRVVQTCMRYLGGLIAAGPGDKNMRAAETFTLVEEDEAETLPSVGDVVRMFGG